MAPGGETSLHESGGSDPLAVGPHRSNEDDNLHFGSCFRSESSGKASSVALVALEWDLAQLGRVSEAPVRDLLRQHVVDQRDFEHRESRTWVVAWALMSLTLIACGVGAFGGGPLSRAEAEAPGGMRVEYERVTRFGTSARLHLFPPDGASGPVRVTIDRPLLDAFRIRQVVPAPESSKLHGDGVELSFGRDAAASAPIVFELESSKSGTVRGTIRSGDSTIALRQFILP